MEITYKNTKEFTAVQLRTCFF